MGNRDTPKSIVGAINLCSLTGSSASSPSALADQALVILRAAVGFLLDDASRSSIDALTHVRGRIAEMGIEDNILDAQVREVIRSLSTLMYEWRADPARLDSRLTFLLERALSEIESQSATNMRQPDRGSRTSVSSIPDMSSESTEPQPRSREPGAPTPQPPRLLLHTQENF
jgi:hypothetical protein